MQAPIITLHEETLKGELRDLIRKTVEEVINSILDAQADELVNAARYERTDERQAYRSGHYKRGLLTQAGKIEVSVLKLRGTRFTSEVIERYSRREESVEEALMEMRLLGVSTRSMEDVTKILWNEGVSVGTVFNELYRYFGHGPTETDGPADREARRPEERCHWNEPRHQAHRRLQAEDRRLRQVTL